METVKSHLIEKTKLLKDNFIEVPKLEARLLLAKTFNKNLNWTYLNIEKRISKKKIMTYEMLIKKKIKKFPTAYLLENKEFYSINFKVNKNTLIPRPETEILIEEIKKNFKSKKRFSVLDLGTGTGCILLSILKEFKNAIGIGIDKYLETIKVAKINSKKNHLSKRAKFINLDWNKKNFFKKILKINKKFCGNGKFHLVVSNPPYIERKEMNNLMQEVKFEPKVALDGGHDGLRSYKKIFPQLKIILSKKGSIFFEIDPKKAGKIKQILETENFKQITFLKDLLNKKRAVFAK